MFGEIIRGIKSFEDFLIGTGLPGFERDPLKSLKLFDELNELEKQKLALSQDLTFINEQLTSPENDKQKSELIQAKKDLEKKLKEIDEKTELLSSYKENLKEYLSRLENILLYAKETYPEQLPDLLAQSPLSTVYLPVIEELQPSLYKLITELLKESKIWPTTLLQVRQLITLPLGAAGQFSEELTGARDLIAQGYVVTNPSEHVHALSSLDGEDILKFYRLVFRYVLCEVAEDFYKTLLDKLNELVQCQECLDNKQKKELERVLKTLRLSPHERFDCSSKHPDEEIYSLQQETSTRIKEAFIAAVDSLLKQKTAALKPGTEKEVVLSTDFAVLTKQDVYNYYNEVKDELLEWFRKVPQQFVIIQTDTNILKRNEDGPIKITSDNFDKWNTGRTVEFHLVYGPETTFAVIDVDPKEDVDWETTKQVTQELFEYVSESDEVSDVEVYYSGGRGFHVTIHFPKKKSTEEVRQWLKDTVSSFIEESKFKDILHSGVTKEGIRLDISTFKVNGSIRAPGSINSKTGLRKVKVDNLDVFEKEDASVKTKKEAFVNLKRGYTNKYMIHHHSTLRKPNRPHLDLRVLAPIEKEGLLEEYERKRHFNKTPEPPPKVNGLVAYSFAIPKGRLPKEGERLLAVETEPHPQEYIEIKKMEIPKGEYGAGTLKEFESGTYEVLDSTEHSTTFRLKSGIYKLYKPPHLRKDQWYITKIE